MSCPKPCGCFDCFLFAQYPEMEVVVDAIYAGMCSRRKDRDSTGRIPHPNDGWGYLCEIKGHMEFCNCTPASRGTP